MSALEKYLYIQPPRRAVPPTNSKDSSFDESIYYNCIISSLINLIIVVYDKYYLLSALIWLVFKDLSYSNGLSFVSH